MNFVLVKISKIISSLSKGIITNYALYILIGVCLYLSIFTFVTDFSSELGGSADSLRLMTSKYAINV